MFAAGGVNTLPRTQFERGQPMEVGAAGAVNTSPYLTVAPSLAQLNDAQCDGGSAGAPAGPAAPNSVDLERTALALLGTSDVTLLFGGASQGATNMCTSVAMAHGYALRYALTQPAGAFRSAASRVPLLSATYAYYFQRVQECTQVRVCVCETCKAVPSCRNDCDPPCVDCGSYLQSAADVFRVGVALATAWPSSRGMDTPPDAAARANALLFRVTVVRCVPLAAQAFVAALQRGAPLAVFLNLTPEQTAWMAAQLHSVVTTAAQLVMPPYRVAATATTTVVGHVVLFDGVDAGAGVFLVRNNYGNTWGVDGRFAIAVAQVNTEQCHAAVAVDAVAGPAAADVGAMMAAGAADDAAADA